MPDIAGIGILTAIGIALAIISLIVMFTSASDSNEGGLILGYFLLLMGGILIFICQLANVRGQGWQAPPAAGIYTIAKPSDGYLPLAKPDDKSYVVFHHLNPQAANYIYVTADDKRANTVEVIGNTEKMRKVNIYLVAEPKATPKTPVVDPKTEATLTPTPPAK